MGSRCGTRALVCVWPVELRGECPEIDAAALVRGWLLCGVIEFGRVCMVRRRGGGLRWEYLMLLLVCFNQASLVWVEKERGIAFSWLCGPVMYYIHIYYIQLALLVGMQVLETILRGAARALWRQPSQRDRFKT